MTYNPAVESVNVVAASGASVTLPDVGLNTMHDVTLTSNAVAFTLPTAQAGKSLTVVTHEDATGGRVATFAGVTWPKGSAASPTIDASSPIAVDGATATTTTAAFSPPAHSLVLVRVVGAGSQSSVQSYSVSDSVGSTYTLLKRSNVNTSTPNFLGGSAEIWCVYLPTGATGMTVSATAAVTNSTFADKLLVVQVITGAAATQSGATASTNNGGNTGLPSMSVTTLGAGSMVVAAALMFGGSADTDAAGSGQTLGSTWNGGGDLEVMWKETALVTNAGTAVTMNLTGTVRTYNAVAAEILAGTTSPTVPTTPGALVVYTFVCSDGLNWLGFA